LNYFSMEKFVNRVYGLVDRVHRIQHMDSKNT
jgi:hypothetical protein